MAKHKVLGLDGFTTEFFQVTWSFMKKNINSAEEESRSNKIMHPAWNATFLALTPKVEQAN